MKTDETKLNDFNDKWNINIINMFCYSIFKMYRLQNVFSTKKVSTTKY